MVQQLVKSPSTNHRSILWSLTGYLRYAHNARCMTPFPRHGGTIAHVHRCVSRRSSPDAMGGGRKPVAWPAPKLVLSVLIMHGRCTLWRTLGFSLRDPLLSVSGRRSLHEKSGTPSYDLWSNSRFLIQVKATVLFNHVRGVCRK
jgi:hypothetical protein